MKFCTKCGKELLDQAVMCPSCGNMVQGQSLSATAKKPSDPEIGATLGWFAVCSGIYFPLTGWVLGGIGLNKSNKLQDSYGRKINIAGIIISSVVSVITFTLFSMGMFL